MIDDDNLMECVDPKPCCDLSRPIEIDASPRLYEDLNVLRAMFESNTPVEVTIRSTRVMYLLYGFCDASRKGFGRKTAHRVSRYVVSPAFPESILIKYIYLSTIALL